MKRGELLDFVPKNKEGLLQNVKAGGSLGYCDKEIMNSGSYIKEIR